MENKNRCLVCEKNIKKGYYCEYCKKLILKRVNEKIENPNSFPFLVCHRCGHIWTTRLENKRVRVCPKCFSPYWNVPRKKPKIFLKKNENDKNEIQKK